MGHQIGSAAATTRETKPEPRLFDQVRAVIRIKHYSPKTEETYVHWTRKFILFHAKRHPIEMGETEVGTFLQHLALNKRVAASTQNQALNALVFLYGSVLKKPLGKLRNVFRAKRPKRLPTVLRQEQVQRLFAAMKGQYALMARLLYGAGLRLSECTKLRVKDIDFSSNQILVRDGKGSKDRITMLPVNLSVSLERHIAKVRAQHEQDLEDGFGEVYLPDALQRKYPNAARSWSWQFVFPSVRISADPRSGLRRRHHVDQNVLQVAMKKAVRGIGHY